MDEPEGQQFDLNLGDDHWLHFWSWNAAIGDGDQPFDRGQPWHGAIVIHRKTDGDLCEGSVTWTSGSQPEHRTWDIEGEPGEHMTLSPSLLCHCGDHGFIRDGKWVRA